jgi:hypothetical protein
LWISRQILREYFAALSRPQPCKSPLPAAELLTDILRFQSQVRIANDGPAVTANLLSLLNSIPIGGKQVHDANTVATMQNQEMKRGRLVIDYSRSRFISPVPVSSPRHVPLFRRGGSKAIGFRRLPCFVIVNMADRRLNRCGPA